MLNLIKMDLYRMFRSVSTWVILIFTVGIAVFCVTMANMDVDAMAEDPQYAQESAEEIAAGNAASDTDMSNADRQIGIYAESDPAWVSGEIDAGELISTQMTSGMLTLLCVIFAAIFGSAEQKNGYIKNIAGQLPPGSHIPIHRSDEKPSPCPFGSVPSGKPAVTEFFYQEFCKLFHFLQNKFLSQQS